MNPKLPSFVIENVYGLPFEIESACRCSFVVRLENGERAFITNENLLYMMRFPHSEFRLQEVCRNNSVPQKWIVVAKIVWDWGFKKRMFDCNGLAK